MTIPSPEKEDTTPSFSGEPVPDSAVDPYPTPLPSASPEDEPPIPVHQGFTVDPERMVQATISQMMMSLEMTQGSLPTASSHRTYVTTTPELGQVFIDAYKDERKLIREEQEHRHKDEDTRTDAEIELGRNGQKLGNAICNRIILAGIVIALIGALTDNEKLAIAGVALISTVIIGLAAVYIIGKNSSQTEDRSSSALPEFRDAQTPPKDSESTE